MVSDGRRIVTALMAVGVAVTALVLLRTHPEPALRTADDRGGVAATDRAARVHPLPGDPDPGVLQRTPSAELSSPDIDAEVPASPILTGVVVDRFGRPVPREILAFRRPDSPAGASCRVRTDSDGRFVVTSGLVTGTWEIAIPVAWVSSWSPRFVDVSTETTTDLRIVADALPAISGRILDRQGRPVRQAYVAAIDPDSGREVSAIDYSDEEGRFCVRIQPGSDTGSTVRLRVYAEHHVLDERDPTAPLLTAATFAWGTHQVALTMGNGAALALRFRWPDGDPSGALQIHAGPDAERLDPKTYEPADPVWIRGLVPGPTLVWVFPTDEHFRPVDPWRVSLEDGRIVERVVVLERAEPVTVRVTGTTGEPIAGAEVTWIDDPWVVGVPDGAVDVRRPNLFGVDRRRAVATGRAATDVRGEATVHRGFSDCDSWVSVRSEGHVPVTSSAPRGATSVRVTLESAAIVEGRLRMDGDARRFAVALRSVRDRARRIGGERGIAPDRGGRFAMAAPAGVWTVELLLDGEVLEELGDVVLESGTSSAFDVDVSRWAPVEVTCRVEHPDAARGRVVFRRAPHGEGESEFTRSVPVGPDLVARALLVPGRYRCALVLGDAAPGGELEIVVARSGSEHRLRFR